MLTYDPSIYTMDHPDFILTLLNVPLWKILLVWKWLTAIFHCKNRLPAPHTRTLFNIDILDLWFILTLLNVPLWKILLVWKGLIAIFRRENRLPAPQTRTLFPIDILDLRHAWRPTDKGSIRAPSSKLTLSGSLKIIVSQIYFNTISD